MYRTCGIQINFDYISEDNFEKIFKFIIWFLYLLHFVPIHHLIWKTYWVLFFRNKIWQNTSRGGIMPIALKINFEKYFDHVINVNLICNKRSKL